MRSTRSEIIQRKFSTTHYIDAFKIRVFERIHRGLDGRLYGWIGARGHEALHALLRFTAEFDVHGDMVAGTLLSRPPRIQNPNDGQPLFADLVKEGIKPSIQYSPVLVRPLGRADAGEEAQIRQYRLERVDKSVCCRKAEIGKVIGNR